MEPDYAEVREAAYAAAESLAASYDPPVVVRITGIDVSALRAFRLSWRGNHPSGYGGFDWVRIWHRYGHEKRRTFHCALWSGSLLCGMMIGTLPRSHAHLTIRYLEGRPGGHPIRGTVARIALMTAQEYAEVLQVPWLRLENPVAGLEPFYRRLGFTIGYNRGKVRYLAKPVLPKEH